MTRSELAKRCGVNIESLRYYEKRRLLVPVRTASGYRKYTEEDAARIRFIKNAQKLGFTLAEIGDLLKLRVDRKGPCGSVRVKARDKRGEVEQKIRDLKSIRRVLDRLIRLCEEEAPTGTCPILASFEKGRPL